MITTTILSPFLRPGICRRKLSGNSLNLGGKVPPAPTSFWAYLNKLIVDSPVFNDRPRNSRHPRYPEIIYLLDYGHLEDNCTVGGSGVDVWLGASKSYNLRAVLLTVDLHNRDTEIKLLLGCTDEEMQLILYFQNTESMRALLIRRPTLQEADYALKI